MLSLHTADAAKSEYEHSGHFRSFEPYVILNELKDLKPYANARSCAALRMTLLKTNALDNIFHSFCSGELL